MSGPSYELCPRCFIGRPSPAKATYVTIFQDQLLSIPNMNAHICDVCGYREFDDESMAWVNQFISVSDAAADPLFPFKQAHVDAEEIAKPKTREP